MSTITSGCLVRPIPGTTAAVGIKRHFPGVNVMRVKKEDCGSLFFFLEGHTSPSTCSRYDDCGAWAVTDFVLAGMPEATEEMKPDPFFVKKP